MLFGERVDKYMVFEDKFFIFPQNPKNLSLAIITATLNRESSPSSSLNSFASLKDNKSASFITENSTATN